MDIHTITRNGVEISRTEIDYDKSIVRRFEGTAKGLQRAEERPLTPEETSELSGTEALKDATQRLNKALQVNRAFLALEKPTATQVAAQVKVLTRQVSALLKLQLREYNEV